MKHILVLLIIFGFLSNAEARRAEVRVDPRDVWALAVNIYHEARGEPGLRNVGWRSVAAVVFNRLEDGRFPDTIRKVILERDPKTNVCAFSWYCDKFRDRPRDLKLFRKIHTEARRYLIEYKSGRWRDPTHGAHSYHSVRIPPNEYFRRLRPIKIVTVEGRGHIFYTDRRNHRG